MKVEVETNEQHRAVYDARTTANVFQKLLAEALDRNYINYNELNKMVKENDNSHRQTNAIADFQLRTAGGFFPHHLIIKLLEQFCHRNVIIKCHDGKRRSKENQHT